MEYPKIQVPDEQVYKLHILNATNEVSHIIVFNHDIPFSNENEELLYNDVSNLASDAQLIYSKQQLLKDDSVRIIKKKILLDLVSNTDLRVSYEEMYLFGHFQPSQSWQTLFDTMLIEQHRLFPQYVDKSALYPNMLFHILTQFGVENPGEIVAKKQSYSIDDFQKVINSLTIYSCIPIGPKSTHPMFQANPYMNNNETFIPTYMEYYENTLLLNYGALHNNTMYLCLAEPVLQFHRQSPNISNAIVDMYFKLLYPFHVKTLNDLFRVRPTLLKQSNALLDKDVFAIYDSIQLFHDVYNSRKSDIEYTQRGIQSFQIQLHPDYKNSLPLEIIFKSIHASALVPFIKYNPGERRENIYRIYSEKISKNGKKVPYLKDKQIMKLSREMGKSGQISLYIQQTDTLANTLYLHFELSGKVSIQCDLKRPLDEKDVDQLIKQYVTPVIKHVNGFLEQTGFSIPDYTYMRDENVSIVNMKYVLKTPIQNRIILRNIGCVYSVFNVFKDNIDNGTAELRFKRVENYQEMDAKTIFIAENRDDIPSAIDGLMLNFNMTVDDAKLEIAKFFDDHADAMGNMVDNPGFPVNMYLDKQIDVTNLVVEITKINNIHYLDVLFVYLDSIVRITQNLRSSVFSRDTIGKICKSAQSNKKHDIPHVKNMVVTQPPVTSNVAAPKKQMGDFDLLKELEIDLTGETPLNMEIDLDVNENVIQPNEVLDGVFFDDDDDFDKDFVSENEIEMFHQNANKYAEQPIVENLATNIPKSPEGVVFDEDEEQENESVEKLATSTNIPKSPEGVFFDEDEDEKQEPTIVENLATNIPKSPEGVFFDEDELFDENNQQSINTSTSPKSNEKEEASPEGMFFDDDYEEEEDNMEGGNVTSDDEEDDEGTHIKNDPAGMSLNKMFLNRLTQREPELYLTSKQGKYKSYASNCQPVNRQPVILTDAEKKKIDKEHPGSYHHAIKYGTDPKNKFWYICPRYWCFLTNTSMTKEEVDSGKCGNIISEKDTTIPKGSYVYEFKTEDHFDEKGNFIEHYPGFALKEDLHPKGYCLPCCFKNWNKGKQRERKEQCTGQDVPDPDGTYEFDDDDTVTMRPAIQSAAPTHVGQKRQSMYVISFDTYPIPETRWGFLPVSAQMFVGTNYADAADKNNPGLILPNKPVMLRYGVEQPRNQSFLGVFADAYAYSQNLATTPRISEFKQILVDAITIDMFLKLHNGSLVSSFRISNPGEIDVYRYRESKFYRKYPPTTDENKQILISTLSAYENFIAYLKDDTQPIDHTYLWDAFCLNNPELMKNGMNFILLEVVNNDVTDKIEYICPTSAYSNLNYDTRKESMIVLKHDEFYEPVYLFKNVDGKPDVQKTFSEKVLNTTLKQLLLNVKYTSKKYCSPLPSVPKVYKFRPPIMLDELIQHGVSLNMKPVTQVLNYQSKVIGVLFAIPDTWIDEVGIPKIAPILSTVSEPSSPEPPTTNVAATADKIQSPKLANTQKPIEWIQFQTTPENLKHPILPKNTLKLLTTYSNNPIVFNGVEYPSVEHAFQAQRFICTNKPELAIELFSSGTTAFKKPVDARNAGGKTGLKKVGAKLDNACWDAKKDDVMAELINIKIQSVPELKEIMKLAKQHNIRFIHLSKVDFEWGGDVDENGMLREGKNKLGDIYNKYIDDLYLGTMTGGADIKYTIVVPCHPSSIRNDIRVEHMDEPGIWSSYEYTRNVLAKLSKMSRLFIPSRPMIKVVDEGLIVGLITETYQFVQINPPEENTIMDDLRVLYNTNFNQVDRVLATHKRPDMERVNTIKNIQLETNFYSMFRSSMRKLITSNREIRAKLIDVIESKTLLYKQKIEGVLSLLKMLGRNKISFENIDRDILLDLNNVEDCNQNAESQYCIVKDDGTTQLIIPKTHLLSGNNNELGYYTRLSDELVRYDRVKMFMFQPQTYLNIRNIDYQVGQDEFLLIQSALTPEYFADIDVLNNNSHIQNTAFELASPSNSQTYSSQTISLADQQYIDVLSTDTDGIKEGALCIKSASIPIVGNTMSMWVRSFPKLAREVVFQNTPACSFQIMISILNDKFGKLVDVKSVKELLWNAYNPLMTSAYQMKIYELLRNQGKLHMMTPVLNGRVSFDALLFSESYYLSDLDIWVLANTYNLPIILFTSTFLKGVPGKVNWLKLGGSAGEKYYFIRSTITAERDNISEYHLVKPAYNINELGEFSVLYQRAIQGESGMASHVKPLTQVLESIEFIPANGRRRQK